MAYVPVPKDLSKVKNKVAFNLTSRQLICFAGAIVLGGGAYLLLNNLFHNDSIALIALLIISAPFFLLAIYERDGLPLEKWIKFYLDTKYLRPSIRVYKTENFYQLLLKEDINENNKRKKKKRDSNRKEKKLYSD